MPGSAPVLDAPHAHRRWSAASPTTPPGMLAGAAAALVAIIGLTACGNGNSTRQPGQGLNPPSSVAATIIAPSDAATASPSQPAAASPSPSSRQTGDVLTQGKLTMKSPDVADLENGVVGQNLSGVDLYLYCSAGRCLLNAMGGLVSPIAGPGSKSACTAAFASRRDSVLDPANLHTGQTLCVQTSESHIGALQILRLPGAGTMEFVFSYTIWR